MKKYLFCAGVLALAVSCTQDELGSFSAQDEVKKGISFSVEIPEAPATRGDLAFDDATGIHDFFWYAEKDRINIWSTNTVVEDEGGTDVNGNQTTSFDKDKKAEYKATKSMSKGDFTSVDDDNLLEFEDDAFAVTDWTKAENEDKKSEFLVVYPTSVTVEAIAPIESNGKKNGYNVTLSNLPAIASQTSETLDGQAVTAAMPMFDYKVAYPTNHYDAVGETVPLSLTRLFGAAIFKSKGVTEYSEFDDNGKSLFGGLKKITLEAKGYDADPEDGALSTANGDINPSILAYVPTGVKYILNTKDITKSKFVKSGDNSDITTWTASEGVSKIELTIGTGNGLEWTDENNAYMAMNYVNRAASKFTEAKPETMQVTWEFGRITFVENWTTTNNWPSVQGNNMFSGMKVLDMANYPYLVTNESSTGANDRALIVNSGAFFDAFSEDNEIMWNGEEYPLTQFNTIISKVLLSDAELEVLKDFTNLKEIELAENTNIPSKTFEGLTGITTINMPKVITIANDAFENTVKMSEVRLASYTFPTDAVNAILLKKDHLVTLDMSGVKTMMNVFPAEGFSLTGFENLVNVYVQEGVEVGSAGFKGCTSLETINNAVNITNGFSAFEGSAITEIKLTNTNIPAAAFKDCEDLEAVYTVDGKTLLAPTKVGNEAFSGCATLKNIDLSKVVGEESVIGEEAFLNCTTLVGMPNEEKNINVLYVGAETIKAKAFAGCSALKYVEFTNAKAIENNILATETSNTVELAELKFKQQVKAATGVKISNTAFGTTTDTKLFINPEQSLSFYEGSKFYPNGDKNGTSPVEITFGSITLE